MKVKVIGAGSIGNHLAHASRMKGWSVDMCDTDASALERTKNSIYPTRYGGWDNSIGLYLANNAPIGGYDLIVVGTPPDTHIQLALNALTENPRALLIEKPLCGPDLLKASELLCESKRAGCLVFTGYDHVVGAAAQALTDLLKEDSIGKVLTLDVEFREYWGGIFKAHPWLSGPADTYLGFLERGGGATGEHSHAINLWQHFAKTIGAGRISEVQAMMNIVEENGLFYDEISLLNFRTENGLIGRCVQDVVTQPPRKWAKVQGSNGFLEWGCGYEPGVDIVKGSNIECESVEKKFPKTRPEDFILELSHIESTLLTGLASPISLGAGLDTMMVISAAHMSQRVGGGVRINYEAGYCLKALETISTHG